MNRLTRYVARAGVMSGLVPVLVLGAMPVSAGAARSIETVTGVCQYKAGTVQGAAAALPPGSTQTGIVCNVYENGVHIGGCAAVLNVSATACAGPAIGIGVPEVCTYAWAVYPYVTVYDEHCE